MPLHSTVNDRVSSAVGHAQTVAVAAKGKPWEEGGGLPGNEDSSDRRHGE